MAVSITTRVISPIVLLIGTLISGISPIAVTRSLLKCGCTKSVCEPDCKARKGKVITSFLIYFGGGVLLATCLVHLLPEAREGFENYYNQNSKENKSNIETTLATTLAPNETKGDDDVDDDHHEEFSLPEFIVCCGFFAVYLLEEIVHFALGSHGHSHIPSESRAIRSLSRSDSCGSTKLNPEPVVLFSSSKKESNAESHEAICERESATSITTADISISGLLTVVALSFHSVFEGFAIGIQGTDSRVWILFAAVSVHKFVIAFVVGLEVLTGGGKRTLVIIYMSVFAAMSPLGMIIATITKASLEEDNPLLVGVLNAIATGTLLYVTFCEILQREEEHKNLSSWKQFIATLLGFGVMCLVQYLTTLA